MPGEDDRDSFEKKDKPPGRNHRGKRKIRKTTEYLETRPSSRLLEDGPELEITRKNRAEHNVELMLMASMDNDVHERE